MVLGYGADVCALLIVMARTIGPSTAHVTDALSFTLLYISVDPYFVRVIFILTMSLDNVR